MSRSRSATPEREARLAAGLVILLLGAVFGPLPGRGAEPQILLLEVYRQGRATGELLEVRQVNNRLITSGEAARGAGIAVPRGAETIDLTAMGAELDEANQRLVLGGRVSAVEGGRGDPIPALPAGWGALMDYDFQALWGRQAGFGGTARLRGFGPPGLAENSLLLAYDPLQGSRARRLDSTLTTLREDGLMAIRAGDVVTGGLSWTRPLRLGGGQIARDFTLRPDLVTAPLTGLSGRVAVPSTVDVLIDGARRLSTDVPAGPFELRDLPVLNGAGEVTLAVRDAAGREQLSTLPFYAAAILLAPEETTWSLSGGAVRRGYATETDAYGDPALMGSIRRGLTSDLTGEAHLETGAGAWFGGVSGAFRVGSLGLLTGSVAHGSSDGKRPAGLPTTIAPPAAGSGLRWGAGFERQGKVISFNLSTLRSTGNPRDVAAALGDTLPRGVDRASASISLGDYGNLGIGWTATRYQGDPTATRRDLRRGAAVELANISWTGRVADGVYAYASGYTALRGGFGSGAIFGISFTLGGTILGSAQMERRGDSWGASSSFSQSALYQGETGWRVNLAEGRNAISTASTEHRASFGTVGAAVEHYAGQAYGRVTARGAVVAMGGLHAVPPIYDAFALIDADGQANVTVLRENQSVGRTDAKGKLLVTGLSSSGPNRLALDTLDLPLDVLTDQPEQRVRMPPRAGAVMRFSSGRGGVLTTLKDAQGQFLPLGAVVKDEGGQSTEVGLDGQAWWPQGARGRITATMAANRRCTTPPVNGGTLRCD